MNAQYYNLQFQSTNTTLSNTTQNFNNQESNEVSKVELNTALLDDTNMQLSRELSETILKNIHNESRKFVDDRVEISSLYTEAQALSFSVSAFIQADSKEIELSLNVSLSRSFVQNMNISISLHPPLQDPLVISLDGTMPSLSSKSFSFDIDSDGESEQVSRMSSGSGFLALDKNLNGTIDNGSELFGTQSGDGFTDLSRYDDDNNGWIDENDAIFDKLRIWQKTDTEDKLISLGEVGIGAIFLGNTITPFSLKSETNQLLGEIRKSGFTLFENGKAGVISQVDLAINSETKEGLVTLESLQKEFSSSQVPTLYKKEDEKPMFSIDESMKKIQSKIKVLESELKDAQDYEKPGLQARIGALYSQMMSLLEREMT